MDVPTRPGADREDPRSGSLRIRAAFRQLAGRASSRWVTPEDLAGHRAQISAEVADTRSRYTRRFHYQPFRFSDHLAGLDALTDLIEQAPPDLQGLLTSEVLRRRQRCSAYATGSDVEIAATVVELDGRPPSSLVREAERILADPPAAEELVTVDSEEAAGRVSDHLVTVGVSGWSVEVADNLAANMSVNGSLRRVRIRRSGAFTDQMIRRLLVHEVDGHVLRWEAARSQPEPLTAIPMGRTVPTEEGLALWCEQQAGVLSPTVMRTYAARVVAVDHAADHGILDVVRRLLDHRVPEKDAVDTALRTKRGLQDPNGPGGSTKDWGYLGGLRLIRDTAATDPVDVWRLRQVKWSVDHLPLVRALIRSGRLRSS